ncbi:hypothetical protein ABZ468_07620 [Streptomyces sp. NPDC005708]|uniref:hypothetical protein n=1 Tax=Streptomyces sp. NPDC005708 TaxID=3154564 RepID=UPI0033D72E0E
MLTPGPPDALADLDAQLRPGAPASIVVAVDAAQVHQETVSGRRTSEAFGRYCRTAVPMILRRLLAAESDLAAMRAAVAQHVAAADQGHDPAPAELLEDLRRRGIDLGADVAAAAELLEAEAYAATF